MSYKKKVKNTLIELLVAIFIPASITLLAILIEYIKTPHIDNKCIPHGRNFPESDATLFTMFEVFFVLCIYGVIIVYYMIMLVWAVFKREDRLKALLSFIKYILFCIITLIAILVVLIWNPNEPPTCDCEVVDCECVLRNIYQADTCYIKDKE
ncbi:hypothetical protein CQA53_11715 [Helicobacter didelphidarum]|uniref:Uncharacterized protein n=1 Tax=Helicobacter didelphidarum TaxID=2040648 RepID=A0A3D8I1J7_9HELI|nr:hypothetical protein [Helicobacter didelphidarum]RDU58965.1 hypothetical protein CQA53_11715 [Helicobacter didelphidarum]